MTHNLWRVGCFGLVCTLLVGGRASSTTVAPPSFDYLVANAHSIFVAEVTGQRSVWERSDQGRAIVTKVTYRVADVWKGQVGPMTELDFLGGTIGEVTLDVWGVPQFTLGERNVLFVGVRDRVVSPLVGFMHGRLRVQRDTVGSVDRVRTFDGRSFANLEDFSRRFRNGSVIITPMTLTELKEAVRIRVTARVL